MGCNYYHESNKCDCCGRYDQDHIGKNSCGWNFHFHSTKDIISYKQWLERLELGGIIFDEYDRKITLDEFKELVEESYKEENWNHLNETGYGWIDEDGYSFTDGEFC